MELKKRVEILSSTRFKKCFKEVILPIIALLTIGKAEFLYLQTSE